MCVKIIGPIVEGRVTVEWVRHQTPEPLTIQELVRPINKYCSCTFHYVQPRVTSSPVRHESASIAAQYRHRCGAGMAPATTCATLVASTPKWMACIGRRSVRTRRCRTTGALVSPVPTVTRRPRHSGDATTRANLSATPADSTLNCTEWVSPTDCARW